MRDEPDRPLGRIGRRHQLTQGVEDLLELIARGVAFFLPNHVIVRAVTNSEMQQAAEMLAQSGQVATLVPEEPA